MRTTIDVDQKLLREAMEIYGVSKAKDAVNEALKAAVRGERLQRLRGLLGKVDLDLDQEALEALRRAG